MAFGLMWDSPFTWKSPWHLKQQYKVESNKNFTNADGLYAASLRLPVTDARIHIPHVFPTFFAGGEFGKNFQSPLAAAEGGRITRGVLGMDLESFFDLSKTTSLKGIGLSGSYVRRVFAARG